MFGCDDFEGYDDLDHEAGKLNCLLFFFAEVVWGASEIASMIVVA